MMPDDRFQRWVDILAAGPIQPSLIPLVQGLGVKFQEIVISGDLGRWRVQTTNHPIPAHEHRPNARLTLRSREKLIVQSILDRRQTAKATTTALLVSERTVHKWLTRYRTGGVAALADRYYAPHNRPAKLRHPKLLSCFACVVYGYLPFKSRGGVGAV